MPAGKALFGWVWLNREHESFMNCAVVHIEHRTATMIDSGGSQKIPSLTESVESDKKSINTWLQGCSLPTATTAEYNRRVSSLASVLRQSSEPQGRYALQTDTLSTQYQQGEREMIKELQSKPKSKSIPPRLNGNACVWESAPSMEVSYYTVDALCAPNAKQNTRESEHFEIGWNEPCGVVSGDGAYPIRAIECAMFS